MKYFKNPLSDEVFAFEQDGSQDAFIPANLTALQPEEVLAHLRVAVVHADGERAWRNMQLANVAWLRDRHRDQSDMGKATSLSADQFSQLLVYIEALRDWPQSEAFPDAAGRPQAPQFLEQFGGEQ